jgi:hypothetical protein
MLGSGKSWNLTPPLKASSLTSVMPDKRGAEHTTAKTPLKASLQNSHEYNPTTLAWHLNDNV